MFKLARMHFYKPYHALLHLRNMNINRLVAA